MTSSSQFLSLCHSSCFTNVATASSFLGQHVMNHDADSESALETVLVNGSRSRAVVPSCILSFMEFYRTGDRATTRVTIPLLRRAFTAEYILMHILSDAETVLLLVDWTADSHHGRVSCFSPDAVKPGQSWWNLVNADSLMVSVLTDEIPGWGRIVNTRGAPTSVPLMVRTS